MKLAFWMALVGGGVLTLACGPGAGAVLSERTIGVGDATSVAVCAPLCLADAGTGCSEVSLVTLPDGGDGCLCEKVECSSAPPEPT